MSLCVFELWLRTCLCFSLVLYYYYCYYYADCPMYEPMSESYEILIIMINVIIITIFAILAILVITINTIMGTKTIIIKILTIMLIIWSQ